MNEPRRNYYFMESPDAEFTVDIAAIAGRKEASVVIQITNNTLEIIVKSNRVDDYAIEYSELSVDISDDDEVTS